MRWIGLWSELYCPFPVLKLSMHNCSLVAVHGLNDNLIGAWTDPATQVVRLRDLLPRELDVARVLTYGYEAEATAFYGSGSADRLLQRAQTFVADLQAERELEGCSNRLIVLLCHGLGGILVKKALAYSSGRISKNVEHLYSIFTSTYALLFFGTPHLGTTKSSWQSRSKSERFLARVRHMKDSPLMLAVEKDSETLQNVTDQFLPLMKQFHIFFFWEEVKTNIGDEAIYIVDESSATPIHDNTERAGIYPNHAQMIRFSSRTSPSFKIVVEALVRYCRDAPEFINRRWQRARDSLAQARKDEAFKLLGTAYDIHNDSRPFQYQRTISARPRNRHFQVPQAVSSIFTGRESISAAVEEAFWNASIAEVINQQRRFVIHGIGGSGKTQFCSKFAQDHWERYKRSLGSEQEMR